MAKIWILLIQSQSKFSKPVGLSVQFGIKLYVQFYFHRETIKSFEKQDLFCLKWSEEKEGLGGFDWHLPYPSNQETL